MASIRFLSISFAALDEWFDSFLSCIVFKGAFFTGVHESVLGTQCLWPFNNV